MLDRETSELKRFSSNSRYLNRKKLASSPRGVSRDPFGYVVVLYKDKVQYFTPDLQESAIPFSKASDMRGIRDLCFTSNRHLYTLKDNPVGLTEFVPQLKINKDSMELHGATP